MAAAPRPPLLPEDLAATTRRLALRAEALAGARVLLLGGTGFVGSWLLETLLDLDRASGLGLHVVLLTRDPAAFAARAPHLAQDGRLTALAGHLEDPASFAPITGITHVVHAASDVNRRMTAPEALACLRTLDQGTEALLQAAARWPLRRLLYVSSAAVYDRLPEGTPLGSDTAGLAPVLDPGGAYAAGKRVAELRCALHAGAQGYGAVIARLGAFLGPLLPLDGGFAAGNFVRDALAGRPIRILGDGTPRRSYQYAADMAVWLWTLLLAGRSGEAVNVGGAQALSLRELAERISAAAGGTGVEVLGTPDPSKPVDAYLPPVDKAMADLGLANEVDLDEAIHRTLRWHSLPAPAVRE